MPTKLINFDLFKIYYGQNKQDTFDLKLDEEFKKNIKTEINVFDYILRIGELKQVKRNSAFPDLIDNKLWIGVIERINVTEEGYTAQIGKSGRKTYATGDDEGPLNDTVFLYDPKSGVLILQRSRGGAAHTNMTNFVSSMCKDENVTLKILVDKKTLSKLDKLPQIDTIEYQIAKPNPKTFRDNKRELNGDIKMLNKMKGEKMKVIIGEQKDVLLDKQMVRQKVKSLLESEDEVSRLIVKGYNNADREVLDLIKHKIQAHKKVTADPGHKVSYIHIIDVMESIFREKENLIKDFI
ncbi:hypothetical protein JMA_22060 [Jeotgalibacillus malaysiensis]|uniref:Uncharacterized protein n=1 Tax=Jeotgalibacillus malaysiensis TaxID=1508404 RepID=A0A0B5ASI4_9BACL|nr:DUF6731 family protein [Jeotgalibacillus malaysiensis]AJD91523.1 hypothetical protein JMA_22060 [Jeotgalibacillus malaysiensis]